MSVLEERRKNRAERMVILGLTNFFALSSLFENRDSVSVVHHVAAQLISRPIMYSFNPPFPLAESSLTQKLHTLHSLSLDALRSTHYSKVASTEKPSIYPKKLPRVITCCDILLFSAIQFI